MTSSLCRDLDRRARPTQDTQSTIAVATSSIVGVQRSRAGITTWWIASCKRAERTDPKPIRDSKMRQRRSGDVGMDRISAADDETRGSAAARPTLPLDPILRAGYEAEGTLAGAGGTRTRRASA